MVYRHLLEQHLLLLSIQVQVQLKLCVVDKHLFSTASTVDVKSLKVESFYVEYSLTVACSSLTHFGKVFWPMEKDLFIHLVVK